MGKYFGTDGFRGRANVELNSLHAFKIGQFLGDYYNKEHQAKIVIGQDTRLSGDMLLTAMISGITSVGGNAYVVGVCPTPCIAYLTKQHDFDCGVMISASHNLYHDNGIKIFNHEGHKLEEDIELKIESYIDGNMEIALALNNAIGQKIEYNKGLDLYLDYLFALEDFDFSNFSIVLDCANGSSSVTAKRFFERCHANVVVLNDQPNGININVDCGSTHIDKLVAYMKEHDHDMGFAYDGDADRLIAVSSSGKVIDGDHTLYICGKYLKEHDQLKDNVVVTTVMSNIGLYKALKRENIKYEQTQVGDKYVNDCMVKNGYNIGGEQSGHIIFSKYATTGDGLLTSIYLAYIVKQTNKSLDDYAKEITIYPQILKNLKVNDKINAQNDPEVLETINKVSDNLQDNGRVLVRASGTEPLLRVMVEAYDLEVCRQSVDEICNVIIRKGL